MPFADKQGVRATETPKAGNCGAISRNVARPFTLSAQATLAGPRRQAADADQSRPVTRFSQPFFAPSSPSAADSSVGSSGSAGPSIWDCRLTKN